MDNKKMKTIYFIYLHKISGKPINSLDDIIGDTRLLKNLWLELIFNPELAKECGKKIDNPSIKDEITKAISWYLAFKWLFDRNPSLEGLAQKGLIKPYPIKDTAFRKDYRVFLKGILPLLS